MVNDYKKKFFWKYEKEQKNRPGVPKNKNVNLSHNSYFLKGISKGSKSRIKKNKVSRFKKEHLAQTSLRVNRTRMCDSKIHRTRAHVRLVSKQAAKLSKPPILNVIHPCSQLEFVQCLGLQQSAFTCHKCGMSEFSSQISLDEHKNLCLKGIMSQKQNISCKLQVADKKNVIYSCSCGKLCDKSTAAFLHMKSVHNLLMCIYCLKLFPDAKILSFHLVTEHESVEVDYSSVEKISSDTKRMSHFLCSSCEKVFDVQEAFLKHVCKNLPTCRESLCVSCRYHLATCNCDLPEENMPERNTSDISLNSVISSKLRNTKNNGLEDTETICDSVKQITVKTSVTKHSDKENIIKHNNNKKGNPKSVNKFCKDSIHSTNNKKSVKNIKVKLYPKMKFRANEIKRNTPVNEKCTTVKCKTAHKKTLKQTDKIKEKNVMVSNNVVNKNDKKPKVKTLKKGHEERISKVKIEKHGNEMLKVDNKKLNTSNEGNHKAFKNIQKRKSSSEINKKDSLLICLEEAESNESSQVIVVDLEETPDTTTLPSFAPSVKSHRINKSSEVIVVNLEETPDTTALPSFAPSAKSHRINKSSEVIVVDLEETPDTTTLPSFASSAKSHRINKKTVSPGLKLLNIPTDIEDFESLQHRDLINTSLRTTANDSPVLVEHLSESISTLPHTESHINEKFPDCLATHNGELRNIPNVVLPINDIHITENIIAGSQNILLASTEAPALELSFEQHLDSISTLQLLKECVRVSSSVCFYCKHAENLLVNCKQLMFHLLAKHKFEIYVNSDDGIYTEEDDLVPRLIDEIDELKYTYFYAEEFENKSFSGTYECFHCDYVTTSVKELYDHTLHFHEFNYFKCIWCQFYFYNYGNLMCHLCPGKYIPDTTIYFRCFLCSLDNISSEYQLTQHLREHHHTCNVCLKETNNQRSLICHIWLHVGTCLNHFCSLCGIPYNHESEIRAHLISAHSGNNCKNHTKVKWPGTVFICDVCNAAFPNENTLKVHKISHSVSLPNENEKSVHRYIYSSNIRLQRVNHLTVTNKPSVVYSNISQLCGMSPAIKKSHQTSVEKIKKNSIKSAYVSDHINVGRSSSEAVSNVIGNINKTNLNKLSISPLKVSPKIVHIKKSKKSLLINLKSPQKDKTAGNKLIKSTYCKASCTPPALRNQDIVIESVDPTEDGSKHDYYEPQKETPKVNDTQISSLQVNMAETSNSVTNFTDSFSTTLKGKEIVHNLPGVNSLLSCQSFDIENNNLSSPSEKISSKTSCATDRTVILGSEVFCKNGKKQSEKIAKKTVNKSDLVREEIGHSIFSVTVDNPSEFQRVEIVDESSSSRGTADSDCIVMQPDMSNIVKKGKQNKRTAHVIEITETPHEYYSIEASDNVQTSDDAPVSVLGKPVRASSGSIENESKAKRRRRLMKNRWFIKNIDAECETNKNSSETNDSVSSPVGTSNDAAENNISSNVSDGELLAENSEDSDENIYCYCRSPYDYKSRMIGCDHKGCELEWFHFKCVGITTAPRGKWFCPDCRERINSC